jgi:ribosome-associated protein
MDIRKLQRAIVDGLEDVKAQNIVVFNTEHLSSLFERVVIASGTSNRQTRALAAGVRDAVKAGGFGPPRTEGEENGEWIIVDCGAAVVHVMQPGIREYYHLEEIWGDKPVRVKLGGIAPAAAKPAAPAPARRSTKPAAAPAAAKKPAAPTRAPARKPAVKAVPPAKKGVTRTVGVKQTPGGKSATRKTAATKTAGAIPPRKTPIRRKPG